MGELARLSLRFLQAIDAAAATTPSAQQRAPLSVAADECFACRLVPELAIELATRRSRRCKLTGAERTIGFGGIRLLARPEIGEEEGRD